VVFSLRNSLSFVLQSKYFEEENVKEREREACNHLKEGEEEEVS
jgi:hypothetical protein